MNKKEKQSGFSIIELLVAAAVLGVISSMAFTGYMKFRQAATVKKTAQEIALAIREAQAYGLGVKKFEAATGETYPGYGIHFELESDGEGGYKPSDIFLLFADVDGDKIYSGEPEKVQEFKIKTNDKITALCAGVGCNRSELDIVYLRPIPVVSFYVDGVLSNVSNVGIVVRSPDNKGKNISVWASGQISVE